MVVVSIQRCKDYELEKVKRSIKTGLDDIGGLDKLLKKSDSVFLKPNLLAARAVKNAVTTNPRVVEAVIILLREFGVKKIALGDSPAIDSVHTALKASGISDICKRYDVEIVELKTHKAVFEKKNHQMKRFVIAKELERFDKLINLPKLKTHSFTMYTGAVKNMFGCIPGKLKVGLHLKLQLPLPFSDMLLDLHNVIRPDINIMDGVIGMEGNGPGSGIPRKMSSILVSKDALALDRVASEILTLKKVPLFIAAHRRGLVNYDLKNIVIKGNSIEDMRLKKVKLPKTTLLLKLPHQLVNSMRNHIFKYPVVVHENCISCGKCEEMCPAGAIKLKESSGKKVPVFDYSKCIRCYCCHEVCPAKAIELKKPLLFRLVGKFFGSNR